MCKKVISIFSLFFLTLACQSHKKLSSVKVMPPLEELDEKAFQPGVGVPINTTEVVARCIGPVIGEFNRLPAFGAAPLTLQLPGHRPATQDGQSLQFAEEGFVEEAVGGGG